MKKNLVAGLNEQEEDEFRQEFIHSSFMRSVLTKVIEDKVNAAKAAVRSKEAYQYAAWPYLQADAIGYERACYEIISLLEK